MADHLLKKARKTTMADLLDELAIEILVRLPAVYLLRCTSVCKSWYSLITSSGFITAQLNKSVTAGSGKANNETLQGWICNFDRAEKRYLLYGKNGRFGEEYSELEYPLENQLGYYRILGCCNGVVCLFIRTGHPNIFLWNPSIRKAVNLRMPSMPQGLRKFVLGFGTHPATYECKVIRIAYNMADSIMSEVPPKVELYTQGTGSWGCISSAPSIRGIGLKWSHAFVNGAVHWLVDDSHRNSIVSFDMGSESFSKTMLPPALANQYLHLNLFGESLALVNRDVRQGSFGCCIWVMKEIGGAKSWTKLFSINRPGVSFKTIGLQANGEVLLSTRSNSLISYDPGTEKLVYTGIKGISSFAFYKET